MKLRFALAAVLFSVLLCFVSSTHAPEPVSMCPAKIHSCRLQTVPKCDSGCWSTALIFPLIAIAAGCFFSAITPCIPVIPFHFFLLGFGMIMGGVNCKVGAAQLTLSLQQWVHLDPPELFFGIFLVPLVFAAAATTEWHAFLRVAPLIFIAAIVIPITNTGLVAMFVYYAMGHSTPAWRSWWPSLMFGALSSITEPVSISLDLRKRGVSENLAGLIEGESLFNDATTVFWAAFLYNVRHEDEVFTAGGITKRVLRSMSGGLLLGFAFALLALVLLTFVHDEIEMEVSLTIAVAYLGFWVAQTVWGVSGVIANVTSGILISAFGHRFVSPCSREQLYNFWTFLAWIANTIVFVYAGLLSVVFVWPCSSRTESTTEYALLVPFFFYLQLIRVFQFAMFHYWMSFRNAWFTWKENLVLGLGGVRGAVSLVLALHVAKLNSVAPEIRSLVLLWTTAPVFLSMIFNPWLVKRLLKRLKMDKVCVTREKFLLEARVATVQYTLDDLDKLCVDVGYRGARWSYVVDNVLPRAWLKDADKNKTIAVEQSHRDPSGAPVADDTTEQYSGGRERIVPSPTFQDQPRMSPTSRGSFSRQSGRSAAASPPLYLPHCIFNEPSSSHPMSPFRSNLNLENQKRTLGSQNHMRSSPELRGRFSRNTTFGTETSMSSLTMPPHKHLSVDFDAIAYGSVPDIDEIPDELWVPSEDNNDLPAETGENALRDIEMRRRVLGSVTLRLRTMTNATMTEFRALIWLENHLQNALQAIDQRKKYDLFEEMNKAGFFVRTFPSWLGFRKSTGMHIFAVSVVVYVLADTLKQEVLQNSPCVLAETEKLFESFHKWLGELEEELPEELEWTHSQLAIHIIRDRQDIALKKRRQSGIITKFEYERLHAELMVVRRRHNILTSRWWYRRKYSSEDRLLCHPLFSGLPSEKVRALSQNIVTRQPGHNVAAQGPSVHLVLQGSVEPFNYHRSTVPVKKPSPTAKPEPEPCSESHQHVWVLPAGSVLCSPTLACAVNNEDGAQECDLARERVSDTQWKSCKEAKLVGMTESEVRATAKESERFRDELARSLAREHALATLNSQKTHHLHVATQALLDVLDRDTVVGRAFLLLYRLPYCSVVPVYGGSAEPMHVQGPFVLLNGTVRVSVLSGPEKQNFELYSKLKGPSLLPAGDIKIQKVREANEYSTSIHVSSPSNVKGEDTNPVIGHVLIDRDVSVSDRLQRWTTDPKTVDFNGRFVMFRHIPRHGPDNDLSLSEVEIT